MGLIDRVKQWVLMDVKNVPRPGADPVGGVPARAVVLATAGSMHEQDVGWRSSHESTWVRKTLDLQRVDRPEQRAKVVTYLSEHEFRVTRVGTEVPVRVHEQTGAILGLDFAAWEVEAAQQPREVPPGGSGPAVNVG